MKKSKITGDIVVMEVAPQSSQGVRTRSAKTLALQRLHKLSSLPPVHSSPKTSSSCYLQLRSRRLEKPTVFRQQQKVECCRRILAPETARTSSRLKRDLANSVSVAPAPQGIEDESEKKNLVVEDENGVDIKASFSENYLKLEVENGSTEETLPSSLTKGPCTVETSDSTRNEMNSIDSRVEADLCRSVPTANDIEEFFAYEELWHQRIFMEKYNFDFANDTPIQGQYEWVQMV